MITPHIPHDTGTSHYLDRLWKCQFDRYGNCRNMCLVFSLEHVYWLGHLWYTYTCGFLTYNKELKEICSIIFSSQTHLVASVARKSARRSLLLCQKRAPWWQIFLWTSGLPVPRWCFNYYSAKETNQLLFFSWWFWSPLLAKIVMTKVVDHRAYKICYNKLHHNIKSTSSQISIKITRKSVEDLRASKVLTHAIF